ncbi:MAG: TIGR01459 family HAD-type hydrolase [Dongiaceae bacterium]
MRPVAIAGLREIADRFDSVLLDQWGALHDGRQVFPAARACVARLQAAGKRVLILSNSGKRADENIRRLAELGWPHSAYDALLTSGEAAWLGLHDRREPPFSMLGRRCVLITRGPDPSIVDGLDLDVVADVAAADFIFLAGVDDHRAEAETWRPLFAEAVQRRLPMLCANPDLTMFAATGLLSAPGALGQFYESLGGQVHYIGKPHAPIFAAALRVLGEPAADRALVVGDSLDHDILGGNRAGMLTALIASGVHAATLSAAADPAQAVLRLAGDSARLPHWILSDLRW